MKLPSWPMRVKTVGVAAMESKGTVPGVVLKDCVAGKGQIGLAMDAMELLVGMSMFVLLNQVHYNYKYHVLL